MKSSRLYIWLLCAGAVALACGPRARGAAADSTAAAAPPAPAPGQRDSTMIASSLDVSVRDGVHFSLHVTNRTGEKVEVRFTSGQTYDFVVLDRAGTEVWRWSADRMFTQAMQTRMLDPDETITFTEAWQPDSLHGEFVAVGKLNSTNYPVEQRVEFSLP